MTVLGLVFLSLILVLAGVGLLLLAIDDREQCRRCEAVGRSLLDIELDVMHRADRIRDLTSAAEAHIDALIAERQATGCAGEPWVVDGEVIDPDVDPRSPRWST